MKPNKIFELRTRQAVIILSIHAATYLISSYIHTRLHILLTLGMYLPLLLIFCVLPLLLAFGLKTKFARPSSILLLALLPSALINNIVNLFNDMDKAIIILNPTLILSITYTVLILINSMLEIAGFWITLKLLLEIDKKIDKRAAKKSK